MGDLILGVFNLIFSLIAATCAIIVVIIGLATIAVPVLIILGIIILLKCVGL